MIAAVTYGTIALMPVLGVITLVKIIENSTDYSIHNTARHALFLPTSREAKYKAKQAIDSFFWRAGDVLQAVVVFVGAELLAFDHTRICGRQSRAGCASGSSSASPSRDEHRKITGEEPLPATAAAETA